MRSFSLPTQAFCVFNYFLLPNSFCVLFINILSSCCRIAVGTGRWVSRLWPVAVCCKIKNIKQNWRSIRWKTYDNTLCGWSLNVLHLITSKLRNKICIDETIAIPVLLLQIMLVVQQFAPRRNSVWLLQYNYSKSVSQFFMQGRKKDSFDEKNAMEFYWTTTEKCHTDIMRDFSSSLAKSSTSMRIQT